MTETRCDAVAPMLEGRCEFTHRHREPQHCVTGRTDGIAWSFRWVCPSTHADGVVTR